MSEPRRRLAVVAPMVALMAAGLGWIAWRGVASVPADSPPTADVVWRVDLNTATAPDLELLPGIGERLAQRIVADRQANGPFADVDELTRVPGIGARTAQMVRRHAAVSDLPPDPPPPKPE